MKITYKEYHAVASWRWNVDPNHTDPPPRAPPTDPTENDAGGLVGDSDDAGSDGSDDDEDSEEEDEMCGVCQQEFESACPACKVPGDDCPLSRCMDLGQSHMEAGVRVMADHYMSSPALHVPIIILSADGRSPCILSLAAVWGACKHVFHMHCLLQWLQTPSSKEQCPLDRRPWGKHPPNKKLGFCY